MMVWNNWDIKEKNAKLFHSTTKSRNVNIYLAGLFFAFQIHSNSSSFCYNRNATKKTEHTSSSYSWNTKPIHMHWFDTMRKTASKLLKNSTLQSEEECAWKKKYDEKDSACICWCRNEFTTTKEHTRLNKTTTMPHLFE